MPYLDSKPPGRIAADDAVLIHIQRHTWRHTAGEAGKAHAAVLRQGQRHAEARDEKVTQTGEYAW